MLKPQDVMVLLHLAGSTAPWTYQGLSLDLGLSASEVHQALRRAGESGLFDPQTKAVRREALLEFVLHGLRYVFPARRRPRSRGVPTAHSAAPLREHFATAGDDAIVWPDPAGEVFGDGLEPLYKSVPAAALRNPVLHRRLALVDAIRAGRARERKLAMELLAADLAP